MIEQAHPIVVSRVDASWAARIFRANGFDADSVPDVVVEQGDAAGWVAYRYCCLDGAKADATLQLCQQMVVPPARLQIIEGGVLGLYELPHRQHRC